MDLRTLYVDEAGNAARFSHAGSPSASPVFVVAGVTLAPGQLCTAKERLLIARRRAFGAPRTRSLVENLYDNEVKAAVLRAGMNGTGSRLHQRRCWEYVEDSVSILEDLRARVFAHVWLKTPGSWLDESGAYRTSLQHFATGFSHRLAADDNCGAMLLDARSPKKDSSAQRAIVDLKYSCEPDSVTDRLIGLTEVASVGDSKNFVGLQLADLVASALLFPMACVAFRTELGIYKSPAQFQEAQKTYGERLAALQCHWRTPDRRRRDGFVVTHAGEQLDARRLTRASALPRPQFARPASAKGPAQPTRAGARQRQRRR
jgi:Protein of unknown function (DUF3800)